MRTFFPIVLPNQILLTNKKVVTVLYISLIYSTLTKSSQQMILGSSAIQFYNVQVIIILSLFFQYYASCLFPLSHCFGQDSTTLLTNTKKVGSYIVLIFTGDISIVVSLNVKFVAHFLCSILKLFSSSELTKSFNQENMLNFPKCTLALVEKVIWFFSFHLIVK